MKLTLPYPPSANRYWRSVGGRVLVSREARQYKALVALLATKDRVPRVDGPVHLSIDVYRPARRGDLDNTIKVLLDSLKGIAFGDDSQVVAIDARRHDDKHNPRAEVEVKPGTTPAGGLA